MQQARATHLDGWRKAASVLRPLCAAALAVVASGCVYTPAPHIERRSSWIGTEASRPIRIGVATRNDVLARLGKPTYATQHDLAWGYLLTVHTGQITGLICGACMPYFGTASTDPMDDVWFEFDSRGVLVRCEKLLSEKYSDDDEKAWREFAKTVPDPIKPEQMLNGMP